MWYPLIGMALFLTAYGIVSFVQDAMDCYVQITEARLRDELRNFSR
jgi:hypothetical protein